MLSFMVFDDFAEIALDYPILLKNAWTVLFVFVLRISYWVILYPASKSNIIPVRNSDVIFSSSNILIALLVFQYINRSLRRENATMLGERRK